MIGEFRRKLDDRFRLLIPSEWVPLIAPEGKECILTKERPGCLSLWNATQWQDRLDKGIHLVRSKIEVGNIDERISEFQLLGRLLSTRHRNVPVAERGRINLPEGFREFLGLDAGSEVMVVGAAICVEIWHPEKWLAHLGEKMPDFESIFSELIR